jgi:hypothetical protein
VCVAPLRNTGSKTPRHAHGHWQYTPAAVLPRLQGCFYNRNAVNLQSASSVMEAQKLVIAGDIGGTNSRLQARRRARVLSRTPSSALTLCEVVESAIQRVAAPVREDLFKLFIQQHARAAAGFPRRRRVSPRPHPALAPHSAADATVHNTASVSTELP